MFDKGKNKGKIFVKRPDFMVIANVYEDLDRLIQTYGMEKVVTHLGEVAKDRLGREWASRIWGLLKLNDKLHTTDEAD